MRVLVTGANGFVGKNLCEYLNGHGISVRAASRYSSAAGVPTVTEKYFINGIDSKTDWKGALQNIDCVVHLAARVHVMSNTARQTLDEYRKVNVDGSYNLARQAVDAGVKRFIYMSSIKVNGESTELDRPFTLEDEPVPVDPYGVSKYEAELCLQEISKISGMELVIIRPPLVYGPGVKANFLKLMRWLKWEVPLPLGSIHNARSLVSLDNLVEFIHICIQHPEARNQTFMVSDGEDLSTPELLQRMARALNVSMRLLPLPGFLIKHGATLLGGRSVYQRLCGSLQVDIGAARNLLGWKPKVTVDESLTKTAQYFLSLEN